MWRVNNELLKTSGVKEDITWEVKVCIKTKENANRSYQNFDLKTIFLKMTTMGPFISLNSSLFYYRCPKISLFPSFLQSTPPPHSPSTHHCPCPWVTQTCFWIIPSPPLQHFPPPSPLKADRRFPVSMALILFCLLLYFVHYIPLRREIMSKLQDCRESGSKRVYILIGI